MLLKKAKKKLKNPVVRDLVNGVIYHFKMRYLTVGKVYPEVVNMMANDICNSKCSMCNIWKRKLDDDITPSQLEQVLKDELFKNVKFIGITGGEPTLRDDLPQLYETACKTLPNLVGMSAITNAIRNEDVIERIEKSAEICKSYGKRFSFMVSLDGYKEVHDLHRGREGNFESALSVIRHFKTNSEIPLAIGCTITKDNVWGVDDLLHFMKKEGIYGRFRIAEYINRLYNNDIEGKIRSFDSNEVYQLSLFYHKLLKTYEFKPIYRRTYKSVLSILNGGKRTMACPYQAKGVVLDSRGQLLYCAPKSKNLGSTLLDSAVNLYRSNWDERERILEENCNDCIHDYHARATLTEAKIALKEEFYKQLLSFRGYKYANKFIPQVFGQERKEKGNYKTIFITGWYGTETVGDKAILGGIVDHYRKKFDNVKFLISAIYPFIVEQTIKELDLYDAEMVPVFGREFFRKISLADELVMGGGPLMEIGSLSIPLWAFKLAKKHNVKTVIFGCGIGPLYTEKYKNYLRKILKYSDDVMLRDNDSVKEFDNLMGLNYRVKAVAIEDPAYDYLNQVEKRIEVKPSNHLACFIRNWPFQYRGDRDKESFARDSETFNQNLSKILNAVKERTGIIPAFYSMHNFVVGGDDRDFYRSFIDQYYHSEHYFEKGLSTVESTVKAMKSAKHCLVMRYHSVLFADSLGVNYTAIDYTNGGKITGYLKDRDRLHNKVGIEEVVNSLDTTIEQIIEKVSVSEIHRVS